jgi:hypothetical protein
MRTKRLIAFSMLSICTIFADAKPLENKFVLDGIRFVKELHKESGVSVFSNNGIRGPGLTLSFIGKLKSTVLEAYNLNIHKVILENGTILSNDHIRTKSDGKHKDGWGIVLGDDKRSVGIQVDLVHDKVSDFKLISGTFTAIKPVGETIVLSELLNDKEMSKEKNIGIEVEMCMNWGFGGRYILLKLPDADKVQGVKVFDEKGKEFKQTTPFNAISDNNLKLYLKKDAEETFKVSINYVNDSIEEKIPFSIHNLQIIK